MTSEKSIGKKSAVLKAIGVVFILIATTGLVYTSLSGSKRIREQETIVNNSLTSAKNLADSLSVAEQRRTKVKNTVVEFLSILPETFKEHKSIFADTLERFYLQSRFPSSKVEHEYELQRHRFPHEQLVYDQDDIRITSKDRGFIVSLDARYSKTKATNQDVQFDIRVNDDLKIYYVVVYLKKLL